MCLVAQLAAAEAEGWPDGAQNQGPPGSRTGIAPSHLRAPWHARGASGAASGVRAGCLRTRRMQVVRGCCAACAEVATGPDSRVGAARARTQGHSKRRGVKKHEGRAESAMDPRAHYRIRAEIQLITDSRIAARSRETRRSPVGSAPMSGQTSHQRDALQPSEEPLRADSNLSMAAKGSQEAPSLSLSERTDIYLTEDADSEAGVLPHVAQSVGVVAQGRVHYMALARDVRARRRAAQAVGEAATADSALSSARTVAGAHDKEEKRSSSTGARGAATKARPPLDERPVRGVVTLLADPPLPATAASVLLIARVHKGTLSVEDLTVKSNELGSMPLGRIEAGVVPGQDDMFFIIPAPDVPGDGIGGRQPRIFISVARRGLRDRWLSVLWDMGVNIQNWTPDPRPAESPGCEDRFEIRSPLTGALPPIRWLW